MNAKNGIIKRHIYNLYEKNDVLNLDKDNNNYIHQTHFKMMRRMSISDDTFKIQLCRE